MCFLYLDMCSGHFSSFMQTFWRAADTQNKAQSQTDLGICTQSPKDGYSQTRSELDSCVNFKISPTHLLVYVWKVKAHNQKKKKTQKQNHTEIRGRTSSVKSPKRKPGAWFHFHRLVSSNTHLFWSPLRGHSNPLRTTTRSYQPVNGTLNSMPAAKQEIDLFLKSVPVKRTGSDAGKEQAEAIVGHSAVFFFEPWAA